MATTVSPLAGASGGCVTSLPKKLRVDNFDQTPTKLCTLAWDQVTDAHLQELVLFSNVECHISNDEDRVSLHNWTTDALEAHRSELGPTFVPSPTTKQADLAATAVTWTDYTFNLDTQTWWKIEVITKPIVPAEVDWSTTLPAAMQQPPALANSESQILFTAGSYLRSYDTADGQATSGFNTAITTSRPSCPVTLGFKADTEGDVVCTPLSYFTGSWWTRWVRADTGAVLGSWQYGAYGDVVGVDYGGPGGSTVAGLCGWCTREANPQGFHLKYDNTITTGSLAGSLPYAGADMTGVSATMVYDSSASRWMCSAMMGQYLRRGDCDAYSSHIPYAGSTYGWTVQVVSGVNMSKYLAHFSNKDFVFGGDDGKVYRRLFSDGSAVWDTGANLTGDFSGYRGAAVDGSDNVYIANAAGKVYKLNSSGVEQWSTSNLGTMTGVPILTDNGEVLVATGTTVIALAQSDGVEAWTVDVEGTGALVGYTMTMDSSGDLFVFQATDDKLHKITIRDTTGVSGQWPHLMQNGKHEAVLT